VLTALLGFAKQLIIAIAKLVASIVMLIVDFILLVLYVVLFAIRKSLPLILRCVVVVVWVAGAWFAFRGMNDLYSRISDPIPAAAVSVAAAIPVVGIVVVLYQMRYDLWGCLFTGGAYGLAMYALSVVVLGHPQTYTLVGVTPTILASVGIIGLSATIKARRKNGKQRDIESVDSIVR
jgi:hypothetical protein